MTVSGLDAGKTLVLQNGANSLSFIGNISQAFGTKLTTGTGYAVTVKTQPTGQTCTVIHGTGTVASANVTNVMATCASSASTETGKTDTFAVVNFGSKTSASYFENFEDKVIGGSSVGQINMSSASGQSISTTRVFAGSKSLQNHYAINPFPKDYIKLSGTKKRYYFSAHVHFTGSFTGNHVWKMGRIGAGHVYSGLPRAGESWVGDTLPNGFGGEIVNSNGIVAWSAQNTAVPESEAVYDLDRWMFYEFEFYAGTIDASDSYTEAKVDGVVVLKWNNQPYLTTGTPDLPTWFLTPMNGLDKSPNVFVNMDNVYSDESRARVIFTNAANYSSSTKFNAQPIVSYSDSQIKTKRTTPSFSATEMVHVHMWKDDGSYVYAGTKVLD